MEEIINKVVCHYCCEPVDETDAECELCGAVIGKKKRSLLFLRFLLSIGGCFALFTIWVGYTLFL